MDRPDPVVSGAYIGVIGVCLIVLGIALGGCGCVSVRKGDFELRGTGADPAVRALWWERWSTNGYECISMDRGTVNTSKTASRVCETVGAVGGAVVGAVFSPAAAGGGAVGGGIIGRALDRWRTK